MRKFSAFTIGEDVRIVDALIKIDSNKNGFLVVIGDCDIVKGVVTDGDIRRAVIRGKCVDDNLSEIYTKFARTVKVTDEFHVAMELFKDEAIKFLPVVNTDGRLVNLITKAQMHSLLLQDIRADLSFDFSTLDTSLTDQEIYPRPWGYYKTTVLNDYFQSKIIIVYPGGQLSLQSHFHREEHWIVVHGNGLVQLDDSSIALVCGSSVFIPKGCRHRLTNTDEKENLIITEVQIGDYFGEDDIIRYEDKYGRI